MFHSCLNVNYKVHVHPAMCIHCTTTLGKIMHDHHHGFWKAIWVVSLHGQSGSIHFMVTVYLFGTNTEKKIEPRQSILRDLITASIFCSVTGLVSIKSRSDSDYTTKKESEETSSSSSSLVGIKEEKKSRRGSTKRRSCCLSPVSNICAFG